VTDRHDRLVLYTIVERNGSYGPPVSINLRGQSVVSEMSLRPRF